ncbi:hypothetical protein KAR91_16960 [Candidatus Pacearchaeota archaeon]|nr:hypothetical protein [Candidatus Pacearchaeota archaeon]
MGNENEVVKLSTEISKENANTQIDMFKDYYEVEYADIENQAALENLKSSENKVRRMIMKGRVEIKEEGGELVVIQKLKKAVGDLTSVTYKEISGKAKIRLKERDDNDGYGKIYSLMGGLCGETDAVMQNFKGVDMSTMEVIGALFLAV